MRAGPSVRALGVCGEFAPWTLERCKKPVRDLRENRIEHEDKRCSQ
jgi:hypothetical protein